MTELTNAPHIRKWFVDRDLIDGVIGAQEVGRFEKR
jgi:hypothetical protein